jgi:hypothetical protein
MYSHDNKFINEDHRKCGLVSEIPIFKSNCTPYSVPRESNLEFPSYRTS